MYIQLISQASIGATYRREISQSCRPPEHCAPAPSSAVIIAIVDDNFRFKISNPRKGFWCQNYHLNGTHPLLARIDDQIIVNKQKCVDSVQPFLTMKSKNWNHAQSSRKYQSLHLFIWKHGLVFGCASTSGTSPILFLIVGRITIITHIKGGGGEFNFC